MKFIFIGIIRLYQITLSPMLGGSCRFNPSCSNYALAAFKTHGVVFGIYLTAKRILKCNPFFKGGYDPVPEKPCSHNLNKKLKYSKINNG